MLRNKYTLNKIEFYSMGPKVHLNSTIFDYEFSPIGVSCNCVMIR